MLSNDQEAIRGNIGVIGKGGTAGLDRDMILGKFSITAHMSYMFTRSFEMIGQ